MSRRSKGALAAHQLTIAWQSVSLLLDYPDSAMLARLDLIRGASQQLPVAIGESIRGFADHLEQTPLPQLQTEYVETFDNRRRCNLFLTYFAHGDTRKRGLALLRSNRPTSAPLRARRLRVPDHPAWVLEFAATVDQGAVES